MFTQSLFRLIQESSSQTAAITDWISHIGRLTFTQLTLSSESSHSTTAKSHQHSRPCSGSRRKHACAKDIYGHTNLLSWPAGRHENSSDITAAPHHPRSRCTSANDLWTHQWRGPRNQSSLDRTHRHLSQRRANSEGRSPWNISDRSIQRLRTCLVVVSRFTRCRKRDFGTFQG